MKKQQKKILLVGDFGVGKSSLMERFVNQRFSEDYKSTIGVVINKKEIFSSNGTLGLLIWDVAGERDVSQIPASYFLGSSGILYVFDLSRPETWAGLDHRIKAVEEKAKMPENSGNIVLVANKSDLCDDDTLESVVSNMSPQVDIVTSAKTGHGVEEAFLLLADRITTH